MPGNYTFTSPIRYFKANDPNYYEVDNIPLRQLEENILYLKNRIETSELNDIIGAGIGNAVEGLEISLSQVKDLKVKPSGGMTIKVNPGRFVARINSINKITNMLSLLQKVFVSNNALGIDSTYTENLLEPFYTQLKQNLTGASAKYYGFNGLETANTFFQHKYGVSLGLIASTQTGVPEYPGLEGALFAGFPTITHRGFSNYANYMHDRMLESHRNFVQTWGGVFRTSVVSVEDQLTIDIDIIKEFESYYETYNGTKTAFPITQRIDLIFAYAVPVDCTSATIADYSQSAKLPGTGNVTAVPRVLWKPEIGIIRGAGVGLKAGGGESALYAQTTLASDYDVAPGKPKILINPRDSDAVSQLVGMKNPEGTWIAGSFPSPDDLINLAPALTTGALESFGLNAESIGQTAIPLAYIVVNQGTTSITKNNILDIRPFLRSTELTYNERAGIAAASPPLSFANTAVGRIELLDAINAIRSEVNALISTQDSGISFLPQKVLMLSGIDTTLGCPIDSGFVNPATNVGLTFATIDLTQFIADNNIPSDVRGIILNNVGFGYAVDRVDVAYLIYSPGDMGSFSDKFNRGIISLALNARWSRAEVEDTNQVFIPIVNKKISVWVGYSEGNIVSITNSHNGGWGGRLFSSYVCGFFT